MFNQAVQDNSMLEKQIDMLDQLKRELEEKVAKK